MPRARSIWMSSALACIGSGEQEPLKCGSSVRNWPPCRRKSYTIAPSTMPITSRPQAMRFSQFFNVYPFAPGL